MAYGNPYGYGYPTYLPQQGYGAQQYAPQMGGMQAQQTTQGAPIWVQGEAGAKSYLVAPGQSLLLMDSEAEVFYIKSTDQSGVPMPLRIFDYHERTGAVKPAQAAQAPGDYVTRAEYAALENKLAEVMAQLAMMTGTAEAPQRMRRAQREEAANDG